MLVQFQMYFNIVDFLEQFIRIKMVKIIILEGLIGAGKTTLLKSLAERDIEVILEPLNHYQDVDIVNLLVKSNMNMSCVYKD